MNNSDPPSGESSTPTSPTSRPTYTSTDDKTLYTWGSFFSILTGHASPSTQASYFSTRDTVNEERDCARCEKDKAWLFAHSPIVRFMRHNVNLLGQDINETNVRCRRCDTRQSGGFDSQYGIMICANHLRNRGHLEDTMAHEMVHAYDHLRFENDDPKNLRHAACTEIRASTLSGECRFGREFFTRGQWSVTQQLQECVRRRAAQSVASRPSCKDHAHAVQLVDQVWDSCFRDTRPFDEIYR